jgi:hypothetical protein
LSPDAPSVVRGSEPLGWIQTRHEVVLQDCSCSNGGLSSIFGPVSLFRT